MKEQIEKQEIEELTNELVFTNNYGTHDAVAKHLYEKGYRKQSEGEWKQKEFWEGGGTWRCTECKRQIMFLHGTPKTENMNFCPNCGAHMKGGAE